MVSGRKQASPSMLSLTIVGQDHQKRRLWKGHPPDPLVGAGGGRAASASTNGTKRYSGARLHRVGQSPQNSWVSARRVRSTESSDVFQNPLMRYLSSWMSIQPGLHDV